MFVLTYYRLWYVLAYRRPVTLTPNAERLAVELSLPVLATYMEVCHGWDSNTQPSAYPLPTAAANS